MISASTILKLANQRKPLHVVTRDFGPERPDGLGGIQHDHYATKAQADRELENHRKHWSGSGVKVSYSTRPASDFAGEASSDYFFILT